MWNPLYLNPLDGAGWYDSEGVLVDFWFEKQKWAVSLAEHGRSLRIEADVIESYDMIHIPEKSCCHSMALLNLLTVCV